MMKDKELKIMSQYKSWILGKPRFNHGSKMMLRHTYWIIMLCLLLCCILNEFATKMGNSGSIHDKLFHFEDFKSTFWTNERLEYEPFFLIVISLSLSWIHFKSTISMTNSLWFRYFYRELTLNSLFLSQIRYDSNIDREFTMN